MHPFHRFYPVYNTLPSQGSLSNGRKEFSRREKSNRSGSSDEEDELQSSTSRRKSPSRARRTIHQRMEQAECSSQIKIPVIKIGQYEEDISSKSPKKYNNILKAKEDALWSNHTMENDNTRRLGPNTNNIIVESLQNNKN